MVKLYAFAPDVGGATAPNKPVTATPPLTRLPVEVPMVAVLTVDRPMTVTVTFPPETVVVGVRVSVGVPMIVSVAFAVSADNEPTAGSVNCTVYVPAVSDEGIANVTIGVAGLLNGMLPIAPVALGIVFPAATTAVAVATTRLPLMMLIVLGALPVRTPAT